ARVRDDPRWPPAAVVVTGDIVQDESAAGYARFRDTFAGLQVPVYCVAGNHDDPALLKQILSEPPFQVGGEAELGPWTLQLLNTFATGDDGGKVGPQQLARLRRRLAETRDRHVLI